MTTDTSNHHLSDLEGRKEKTSLGPFFRKQHEQQQSTSDASGKHHDRSDSKITLATASSSLSGDTESDKQASYGDKSSNLSGGGSIEEEEEEDSQGETQTSAASSTDPEQPPDYDDDGNAQQEGVEVDTEGGIWQSMFDGMSSLMASTGMEVPLGAASATTETTEKSSSSYRSQPMPQGQKLHEEEKKDEHDARAVEPAPMATKDEMGTNDICSQQEEEAMLRFDLLKDLIMLGEAEMDDDDISPPNPYPLEDDEVSSHKKGYYEKDFESSGCSPRAKKTILCTIVALVLLSAVIIPIYMSNDANRKTTAALAVEDTLRPTANPTTPSPTTTMRPSNVPTVSQMPSETPSEAPSVTPTMSSRPTISPSLRPTASNFPSQIPSISQIPSLSPSKEPSTSKEPSHVPSELPSLEPSVSLMPSYSTISPDYSFKIRLQWQESYFWQEEKVERWWCLECVRCTSYGGGDGNQHGCKSYGTGDEGACQRGDSIWIRDCRERSNRFNVLENRDSGNMLRIATTDLCVTRQRRRWLMVDYCDRTDMKQQFVPWEDYDKFELRPLEQRDLGEREADCISQLHHPKQDELVSLHNCRLCRIYETRYWQVYLG
ncbi:unnamed protein product [Cylindrotheca closterium]|uniref:Ricin B lectin domain-containing protein n=1 Tax=Cylindrotheca closterium TaxID=2856 RepID=A0AAD2FNP2_9STRA|nr:unnamed protein product [Cylindrotheca closterium]